MSRQRLPRFIATLSLLIMAALQLSTLSITAPTFDEPMHITRGYTFIARGVDYVPGFCSPCSPVLGTSLSGVALLLQPNLQLPAADDAIWQSGADTGLIESFMWANSASPQQVVFLARLPIIFVSLLLGALIYRWAKERSSAWPAVGALTLYVFCPNMLAHSRLATTDVVAAATYALSAYAFLRALERPRRLDWIISGVALGLALAAKVSAVWLIITFGILTVIEMWRQRREKRRALIPIAITLTTLIVGGITLWGIYRFSIGPVTPGGLALPAPTYWREWLDFNVYLREPTPGYLFGQVSQFGWWYYFPIAFAVKTPLPVLILLLLAVINTVQRRSWYRDFKLWLAPVLLFVSLLFSPHDLGYRYLLPLLPFVFVACADVFAWLAQRRWTRVVAGLLIAWHIIGTLLIYPYYLAYFNEFVGEPDRGRFILSDSNLDWGQDLIGLKDYVDQHQIDRLKFSYFGATDPAAYGLQTEALPPVALAMHKQSPWWLHTYHPTDPPPGHYAISATSLMGGIWADRSLYAAFRAMQPDAVIGHSIYMYTVPPRGGPVSLSLAGLQIDQIDEATYGQFETNDVRPRWFDATRSIIAGPDRNWIAIADDQPIAPELAPLFEDVSPVLHATAIDDQRPYALYHFDLASRLNEAAQRSQQHTLDAALPVKFGDSAELIGYDVQRRGNQVSVVTYWRVGDRVAAPLQLFVHAIGSNGSIVGQGDRLDVPAYGWRSGDVFAQVTYLDVPAEDATIMVGLYNPDSGQRLTADVDGREVDRLPLMQVKQP
jgi:hypothetical protein